MTETDKFNALFRLFADYFVDAAKPETDGRRDVLKAKVVHLLATRHAASGAKAEKGS